MVSAERTAKAELERVAVALPEAEPAFLIGDAARARPRVRGRRVAGHRLTRIRTGPGRAARRGLRPRGRDRSVPCGARAQRCRAAAPGARFGSREITER